jgi:hypothetical protein
MQGIGFATVLLILILYLVNMQLGYIKLAVFLLLLAMVYADAFKPFAFIWFGISKILGMFVSKIVLSLVFIVIVLPVSLLRRVMGKDDMKLKAWKNGTGSVFKTLDHTYTKEDLTQPF